jgi:DNA-damage-inducible protein J
MASATVQSRVNPELKEQAEALFAALGMSTADAIRIFLQQAVNEGGLPFRPTLVKQPNAQTQAAMAELERGGGTHYETAQAMYDDLGI